MKFLLHQRIYLDLKVKVIYKYKTINIDYNDYKEYHNASFVFLVRILQSAKCFFFFPSFHLSLSFHSRLDAYSFTLRYSVLLVLLLLLLLLLFYLLALSFLEVSSIQLK